MLQIDSWDDDTSIWLQSTLRFIAREARALRPGGETVITRLADVLVVQAIRSWLDSAPEAKRGWLAALRDDQMGRALALIHRAPERDWSVASLAKEVGMSRSAFSARLTELLGEPVMRNPSGELASMPAKWRSSSERISWPVRSSCVMRISSFLLRTVSSAAESRAF